MQARVQLPPVLLRLYDTVESVFDYLVRLSAATHPNLASILLQPGDGPDYRRVLLGSYVCWVGPAPAASCFRAGQPLQNSCSQQEVRGCSWCSGKRGPAAAGFTQAASPRVLSASPSPPVRLPHTTCCSLSASFCV